MNDRQQGGIADFNQAIKISPNNAAFYKERGVNRVQTNDLQGGIADLNQAIKINPNDAPVYSNRGLASYLLGDKQLAIANLQKAADLSLQQENTQLYQKVLELIKKVQQ